MNQASFDLIIVTFLTIDLSALIFISYLHDLSSLHVHMLSRSKNLVLKMLISNKRDRLTTGNVGYRFLSETKRKNIDFSFCLVLKKGTL